MARQTDNKVSMEEATSLDGRRKALAARRTKAVADGPPREPQGPGPEEGKGEGQGRRRLEERGAKGKDKIPMTALCQINPTYRGSDVIPEHLGGDYGPR